METINNFNDIKQQMNEMKTEIVQERIQNEGKCHVCDMPGHRARQCPLYKPRCFNCGKEGHVVAACQSPRNERNIRKNRTADKKRVRRRPDRTDPPNRDPVPTGPPSSPPPPPPPPRDLDLPTDDILKGFTFSYKQRDFSPTSDNFRILLNSLVCLFLTWVVGFVMDVFHFDVFYAVTRLDSPGGYLYAARTLIGYYSEPISYLVYHSLFVFVHLLGALLASVFALLPSAYYLSVGWNVFRICYLCYYTDLLSRIGLFITGGKPSFRCDVSFCGDVAANLTSDMRPDAHSAGSIKHEKPLLAWFLIRKWVLRQTPLGVFPERRSQRLLVSIEALSQFVSSEKIAITNSDKDNYNRILRGMRNLCTMNYNRFDFLHCEDVLGNTAHVALHFCIFNRQRREKMLPSTLN